MALDVDDRQLVGEVRETIRRRLRLDGDEETAGTLSGQRKTLLLSYAGAVLDVAWRFADIGIPSGAQVPATVTYIFSLFLRLCFCYSTFMFLMHGYVVVYCKRSENLGESRTYLH